MEPQELSNYRKAGKILKETIEYAKSIIKPNMSLLEIAEKIESRILEVGGKPAFPVNLSINEIAAHYTPSWNDETKASGLLKVDIGVQVEGYVVDTAFSLDLENKEENKKLIEASENALKEALKIVKKDVEIFKIGKAIQETIQNFGFSPIINLSGHEIKLYNLHAGITIPNHNNNNINKLKEGVYAIEPFSTKGKGKVYDGKPSGIYKLRERKGIRDAMARKILEFIEEEYKTLPFCSRWIVKKFGTRSLLALNLLEQAGILHHFPQLIEQGKEKVSQAETTIIIGEKVEVLV